VNCPLAFVKRDDPSPWLPYALRSSAVVIGLLLGALLLGMNLARTTLLVMALSGELAALAGVCEVAGVQGQLQHGLSPGYGYTAIIVAWLARLDPWPA
jgi:branched-subunit amino acid ABC-type transport system permease component